MSVGRFYLVGYNCVQCAGWSLLFYQVLSHLLQEGGSLTNLYSRVCTTLQIFQTGAALEIVHAAVGLVRSNLQVTAQQVFSRVYVTWAILHLLPDSRLSLGLLLLLLAWTITEMIRYSMYAIQLVASPPYFLTWLRYTFFIVAYPVGVTGELLCSYAAFQQASASGMYSLTLPNQWNATFSLPTLIALIGLAYIPLFPPMYLHMFTQRRKIIGGAAKQE